MEDIILTLNEHKLLLDRLGYSLNIDDNNIEFNYYIFKNNIIVGNLTIWNINIDELRRNYIEIANDDIDFNEDLRNNVKTIFHTLIIDDNRVFNNYNLPINKDRNYIGLSDDIFGITKYVNDNHIKLFPIMDEEVVPILGSIINFIDETNEKNYLLERVK